MNLTDVTDCINRNILHLQAENRMNTLKTQIKNLQIKLSDALHQLRRLERDSEARLAEDALASIQARFSGMELSIRHKSLVVSFPTIPFVFHLSHDFDETEETDIYQTLPLYSFTMEVAEKLVRIQNVTHYTFEFTGSPNGLLSTISDNPYSHPHVTGCNSAAGDFFESICYGNNKFPDLLDRSPLRPDDIIEFLQRAALWISRGNLNDSYHTPLYSAPVPDESLLSPGNQKLARELFRFSLSLRPLLREGGPYSSGRLLELVGEFQNLCGIWPSRLSAALESFGHFLRAAADDSDGNVAEQRALLALAHFCYVFWLYEEAARKVALLRDTSLQAAMLTDLDSLLTMNRMRRWSWLSKPSNPLPAWRKALYDNPLHLRRYLEHLGGMVVADRRDLLAQLPTP